MKLLAAIACIALTLHAQSQQFAGDNVKYKTVYPEDLCKTLQQNKNYIILDVRSAGEYHDTLSSSESLNIGHIKNAKHIDIRQLPQRWRELQEYKDQPVFVYCSHSQRSRRASRMLADSGFTKLFNINGGLTDFYMLNLISPRCPDVEIENNLSYKLITPKQLVEQSRGGTNFLIIDLRDDSTFRGISLKERARAQGRFEGAVNIPFARLESSLSSIKKGRPVLLVDEFGGQSPKAARLLESNGFENVSVLFNGMDSWVKYTTLNPEHPIIRWDRKIDYRLLSADKYYSMSNAKGSVLIDIRPKAEYSNTAQMSFRNIGQVKGSVNIPLAELNSSSQLPSSKDDMIVLHGFTDEEDVYAAARQMKEKGYKNVSILYGGIWGLRWSSYNQKQKDALRELVVNVPAENQ